MTQLLSFIKKEFKHVFRDKKTLLMLFGLPTIQILLFGFALTNEIKNTRVAILDYAQDNISKELISKIDNSKYFDIISNVKTEQELEAEFRKGNAKIALVFPAGLEK